MKYSEVPCNLIWCPDYHPDNTYKIISKKALAEEYKSVKKQIPDETFPDPNKNYDP